jgi:thiamine-phosphate pyrophosphorylase
MLTEARGRLPPGTPLVAIGGITAERLVEVRAAGADAWAVIGAITGAADRAAAIAALRG